MKILMLGLAAVGLVIPACAPVDDGVTPPPADALTPCKADQYQGYIGRNRSELPPKPEGAVWRVTCTTCPVTMDYNPTRLNILFDRSTEVIREVKCG